ncbi:DUF5655 domain-containing protein [Aegicerativicinus sediminis]|uniref:DUF5655 domain-containing protein n=1 Tax=Aegicerativicinus sediminis TaxID=2893202 RepID=UPI001E385269|nr:DUF5655 domain-containing protein [Aegicerativicinus sediminis]
MKLYNLKDNELTQVPLKSFKLEKDIQQLVEANVEVLFDLEFVRTEFPLQQFRLDSLCYDRASNAFVIIEYKKGSSYSVIDQGYTYLSLMLNNKADFILEYNERLNKNLRRDDVDWTQSRIIFVSPKFSEYQKHSINFRNVPFDLWEITRYDNHTVGLNKIETSSDVDINDTIDNQNSTDIVKQVSNQIVKYDEEYHLYKSKSRPERVVELYFELKNRVLELGDDIEIKFGKQTIGFKANKIFADFIIYDYGIGIMLNMKKGEMNGDFKNLTRDMSKVGHWGNGDYKISVNPDEVDVDYVISLIKESYINQS